MLHETREFSIARHAASVLLYLLKAGGGGGERDWASRREPVAAAEGRKTGSPPELRE